NGRGSTPGRTGDALRASRCRSALTLRPPSKIAHHATTRPRISGRTGGPYRRRHPRAQSVPRGLRATCVGRRPRPVERARSPDARHGGHYGDRPAAIRQVRGYGVSDREGGVPFGVCRRRFGGTLRIKVEQDMPSARHVVVACGGRDAGDEAIVSTSALLAING